tara:strand:+ start:625 stop:744 length:120 start_codon:yes stop_codon:yes gene_type:complete
VIRKVIHEYLEGKKMGYGSYLQVQGERLERLERLVAAMD